MTYDDKTLKAFAAAAQSLRLYRRAELRNEATDELLVEQLYVDPLAANAALQTMLQPNTTFVIGRKGTGKSTLFQRAQQELRKSKNSTSAYVDIKTVFESSEADPTLLQRVAAANATFPAPDLRRLLIYRSFVKAVLTDIQEELAKQIDASLFAKIKEAVAGTRQHALQSIRKLASSAFEMDEADVTATMTSAIKETKAETAVTSAQMNAGISTSGGTLGSNWQDSYSSSTNDEHTFSKVIIRTFDITRAIGQLKAILNSIGIRHLYVFIDDFSELPQEAMAVFVDAVLAPLNNWSDELVKFKVAAYPARIYLGQIDKTKMDELYLDTYNLYGNHDINTMEEKSIDFTKRLIDSRFQYYLKQPFAEFCEGDIEQVHRTIFFSTMGNPRILGHLLAYLRESHIVYGNKIGVRAINEASQRYYEEKVEPFFGMQKFAHTRFDERSSLFSLKELLEQVVTRARELRSYKESSITRDIRGRTPSSHFYVLIELDALLTTLELNFFMTKYYEMKDRDGRAVSIYALNYGLCVKHSIAFGRPEGKREHRLYYVERVFDQTAIMRRFLEASQEIRCESCSASHSLASLDSIRLFGMLCPTCKQGTCQVVNLSRRYEAILNEIDENLILPATELGILETLYSNETELGAKEIAAELDCSYQLVGKRGKIMEERGLVSRLKNNRQRRMFKITKQAEADYFLHNSDRHLDIANDKYDDSVGG